jgi:hypothetical protein
MAGHDLERIRNAIRSRQYTLTEHAYDEMDEDGLDVLDVELAILTGQIQSELTDDPRGKRYVIVGQAVDPLVKAGVVGKFVERDHFLIITVYVIE